MDHYHDRRHQELVKIASEVDLPEYVKDTDFDPDKLEKLADHDFAWPEAGLFPVHTPGDTILSATYYFEKKSEFTEDVQEKIENRLVEAAFIHDVKDDLLKIAKGERAIEKKASVNDDWKYCLIKEHNGETLKLYPVQNADDLEKAASYFEQNWKKYPVEWRYEISDNLWKKADEFDVDEIKYKKVQEYGQRVGCDFVKAASFIKERIQHANSLEYAQVYYGLANALLKKASAEEEVEEGRVIDILMQLDEVSGVDRLVKRGFVPDPHSTVYNVEKDVTHQRLVELDKEVFTEDDLANTPRRNYEAALGEEFVESVSDGDKIDTEKLLEVIPTLPLDDKQVLIPFIERVTEGNQSAYRKHVKAAQAVWEELSVKKK